MTSEKQEYSSYQGVYIKGSIHAPTRGNTTKKTKKLEIVAANIIFTLTLTFSFYAIFSTIFSILETAQTSFLKGLLQKEI